MPRYVFPLRRKPKEHDLLVERLAAELKAEQSTKLMPLVLERELRGGELQVDVIWDAWEKLDPAERYDVIVDAYKGLLGPDAETRLLSISGSTPREALIRGLLPYVVQPVPKADDTSTREQYESALEAEAMTTVLRSCREGLRYATSDDAVQAQERLTRHLPGSHWAIVRMVPADESELFGLSSSSAEMPHGAVDWTDESGA